MQRRYDPLPSPAADPSSYYNISIPYKIRQCGVQARVTSLTAMLDLAGLIEIVSSFLFRRSVAAANASLSDLNCA